MDLAEGDEVQIQAEDIEDAPVLRGRVVRLEADGVGLMFCDD
jgi:hypothetical protein